MRLRADFHIHSCLSPCGGLDMAPSAIVRVAQERGLTAIALSDHNSARNCPAFAEHCRRRNMKCLFGIEVNTIEEVHMLCLFDRLEAVMDFGRHIEALLPDIPNRPDRFGDQVYVDVDDYIIGTVDRWLISAVDLGVEPLLRQVHERDGLCIPAHVDRPSNSLATQLGFIPDEPFDAIEVTRRYEMDHDPLRLRGRYPVVTHSDAHTLDQVGRTWYELEINRWDVPAIREAFHKNLNNS